MYVITPDYGCCGIIFFNKTNLFPFAQHAPHLSVVAKVGPQDSQGVAEAALKNKPQAGQCVEQQAGQYYRECLFPSANGRPRFEVGREPCFSDVVKAPGVDARARR